MTELFSFLIEPLYREMISTLIHLTEVKTNDTAA